MLIGGRGRTRRRSTPGIKRPVVTGTEETVVQVAGSGVILLRKYFATVADLLSTLHEHLGGGLYTVFSDVALMNELSPTMSPSSSTTIGAVPPTAYVKISMSARDASALTVWSSDTHKPSHPGCATLGGELCRIHRVTGRIPKQISLLRDTLISLCCIENPSVTGPIPNSIGDLLNLRKLRLVSCPVTGRLPTELGRLGKVYYLEIEHTSVCGRIPTEVGLMTSLSGLYLSHNNLTGKMPSEVKELWSKSPNLTRMLIDGNAMMNLQTLWYRCVRLEPGKASTIAQHSCTFEGAPIPYMSRKTPNPRFL